MLARGCFRSTYRCGWICWAFRTHLSSSLHQSNILFSSCVHRKGNLCRCVEDANQDDIVRNMKALALLVIMRNNDLMYLHPTCSFLTFGYDAIGRWNWAPKSLNPLKWNFSVPGFKRGALQSLILPRMHLVDTIPPSFVFHGARTCWRYMWGHVPFNEFRGGDIQFWFSQFVAGAGIGMGMGMGGSSKAKSKASKAKGPPKAGLYLEVLPEQTNMFFTPGSIMASN